ncbi:RNA polymerase II-associated protein 3 [Nowakowskiella sp. JEL0407]|nr:RNA polymerase II-associated protein 3 [Nowakowskiella sp. JEL0407]
MDTATTVRQNANELKDYLSSLSSWESEMKDAYTRSLNAPKSKDNIPPIRFSASENPATADPTSNKEDLALLEKEKGNIHFKNKNFTKALSAYSKSLSYFPTASVYTNRALIHLKLNNLPAAISDCTLAMDLEGGDATGASILPNPESSSSTTGASKNVKAYWRRGLAKLELSMFRDALVDLKYASVLEPGNKSIKGDMERCEKALKEAGNDMTVPPSKSTIPNSTATRSTSKSSPATKSIPDSGKIESNSHESPIGTTKPIETSVIINGSKSTPQPEPIKRRLVIEEFGEFKEPEATSANYAPEPKQISVSNVETPTKMVTNGSAYKSTDTPQNHSTSNLSASNSKSTPPDKQKELKPTSVTESLSKSTDTKSNVSNVVHESTAKDDAAPVKGKQPVKPKKSLIEIISVPEPVKVKFNVPTTMYEFERDWKSLKNDYEGIYDYIKAINPKDYIKIFKSSLESSHMEIFIKIFKEFYIPRETKLQLFKVMNELKNIPRFKMLIFFLSKSEKRDIGEIFTHLRSGVDDGYTLQDVSELEKIWT